MQAGYPLASQPAPGSNWFAPTGFTVPGVESDPSEGGIYRLAMRSPDGQDFWSQGTYREVLPPERLVLTQGVLGPTTSHCSRRLQR